LNNRIIWRKFIDYLYCNYILD